MANPSASYNGVGIWTVTLIVSDGTYSDTVVKTSYIQVFQKPEAYFTDSTGHTGCVPFTVGFEDISVDGDTSINTWSWIFGDGAISNQQNPVHTYTAGANYKVTLTVTDKNGCWSTFLINDYVRVSEPPIVQFSANPVITCGETLDVSFLNSTSGATPLSCSWDFGDGYGSSFCQPQHTYSGYDQYSVSLSVTDVNGCSDSLTINDMIALSQDIVADFSADYDTGCVIQPIVFTADAPGAVEYYWSFGNNFILNVTQTSVSMNYINTGDYVVTMIAYGASPNCIDTVTQIFHVEELVVDFSADTQLACMAPTTVQFSDQSEGAESWSWNFGDGGVSSQQNPSHTYTQEGSFPVVLSAVNGNGCIGKDSVFGFVRISPPVASITVNDQQGCIPHFVDFSGHASNLLDSVVSWEWNFDDAGATASGKNVSHTFVNHGDYYVELIITTQSGCTDTTIFLVEAGIPPNVGMLISPPVSCAFDPVSFADNSDVNGNHNLVDFSYWYFGDGGSYSGFFNNHQYVDTGMFTITHIAGYNGCYDTLIYEDTIEILGPVIFSNMDFDCESPFDYTFSASFIAANRWTWDFESDGTIDAQTTKPWSENYSDTVYHSYPVSGNYIVTVVAYNDVNGCTYITNHTAYVRDIQAGFYPVDTLGCEPMTASFVNTSVDADGYIWHFGYGPATSAVTNPSYLYPVKGNYLVTLIAHAANGCLDTMVFNAIQVHKPIVDFTSSIRDGCVPLDVQFYDNTATSLPIVSWYWEFGDAAVDNVEDPLHTYYGRGVYPVRLTVIDSIGCTGSDTKFSYIIARQPVPVIGVSPPEVCLGDSVQFTNASYDLEPALGYLWDFGDLTFSTSTAPSHIYGDSGWYSVTITVTDTVHGCDSTITVDSMVHIQPIPVAGFYPDLSDTSCYPATIHFYDTTNNPYITGYEWSFDNTTATSQLQNPVYQYEAPGVYDVYLIVTSSVGCTDTALMPDLVHIRGPEAEISIFPDSICKGDSVFFLTVSSSGAYDPIWDFGDGYVDSLWNTSHVYEKTGIVYSTVFFYDSLHTCQQTRTDSTYIFELIAAALLSDTSGCTPFTTTLTNISEGYSSYVWVLPSGGTSTDSIITVSLNQAGSYSLALYVNHIAGCLDSVIFDVLVFPLPQVLLSPDTIICKGDSIMLTASGGVIYHWAPDEGLSFDEGDTVMASPSHQTLYYVIVTDTNGCVNSGGPVNVNVQFPPDLYVCADTTIHIGDMANICAWSAEGVLPVWDPLIDLDCPFCYQTISSTMTTTEYTITVRDTLGCFTVSGSMIVTVDGKCAIDVPDAFTPNGDGKNDILYAKGYGIKELEYFRIYNRWGELVFETTNMQVGWDGTYKGKPQNMDTYAFVLRALMLNGQTENMKGNITLIR